jgi:hypothetical protein
MTMARINHAAAAGAAVATRTFTYTGAGQTHAVPADATRSHRDRGRRNLQQCRIEEAGITASARTVR